MKMLSARISFIFFTIATVSCGEERSIRNTLDMQNLNPATFQIDPTNPNYVHQVVLNKFGEETYRNSSYLKGEVLPFIKSESNVIAPKDKLSPAFNTNFIKSDKKNDIRVIITLEDDREISFFENFSSKPLDYSKRSSIITEAITHREEQRNSLALQISKIGGKVIEGNWLTASFLAEIPKTSLSTLAEFKNILYIEPQYQDVKPPYATSSIEQARQIIQSDQLQALNGSSLGNVRIGLIDSGVRSTHTHFTGNPLLLFDCVNSSSCNGSILNDPYWNHGTSSASIIFGNLNLGNDYRGITTTNTNNKPDLDSFNVYTQSGLDVYAAVNAMSKAVSLGDQVVIWEVQGLGGNVSSAMSTAVNNGYQSGVTSIVANGNYGPNMGSVADPAQAHMAVGIGAVDVNSLSTMSYQGHGPTVDGRIKPDIQAPTNTYAASANGGTQIFTGTSGSTPYAGAVAALMHRIVGSNIYVIPWLLASGSTPSEYITNNAGLGLINIGYNFSNTFLSYTSRGVNINSPSSISIAYPPQNTTIPFKRVRAAINWLDTPTTNHPNYSLQLTAPNGAVYNSNLSYSTFEFINIDSPPQLIGNWTAKISMLSGTPAPRVNIVFTGSY